MNEIKTMAGDCLDHMQELPADSVDLIMTSPPYAMRRKETYGGVPANEYVGWFMERSKEMKRILKPTGSFILNIKEHCEDGERHRYVYDLVLTMREDGWRLVDELIWHKKNAMPGKFPGRFKDGFERLYHFTKAKGHYCNQAAVAQPVKESTVKRYMQAVRHGEEGRTNSSTGSGFGKDMVKIVKKSKGLSKTGSGMSMEHDKVPQRNGQLDGLKQALPSNVLHLSAETTNKGHSAVFPQTLPEFFIKSLCPPGGLVLDPFVGSGTTLKAAYQLDRDSIGIESNEEYYAQLQQKVLDWTVVPKARDLLDLPA